MLEKTLNLALKGPPQTKVKRILLLATEDHNQKCIDYYLLFLSQNIDLIKTLFKKLNIYSTIGDMKKSVVL